MESKNYWALITLSMHALSDLINLQFDCKLIYTSFMQKIIKKFQELVGTDIPERPELGMRWGKADSGGYTEIIGINGNDILLMNHFPNAEYVANWYLFRQAALKGEMAPCKLSKGWELYEHQKENTFRINTHYKGQHKPSTEKEITDRRQFHDAWTASPLI